MGAIRYRFAVLRWRSATTGAVALTLLASCVSAKQLKPAFDANEVNVVELAANVERLLPMLEQLAKSALQIDLEQKRTATLAALHSTFCGSADSEQQLVEALSDETAGPGARVAQANKRLSTAKDDDKAAIFDEYPVAAPLAAGLIRKAQIVEHCAILKTNGGSQMTRNVVADEYPTVDAAKKAKASVLQALASYRKVVEQQSSLAKQHATLFSYAATAGVDVNEAFRGVIGDDGFQSTVLSTIEDDTAKAITTEAFGVLEGLLE